VDGKTRVERQTVLVVVAHGKVIGLTAQENHGLKHALFRGVYFQQHLDYMLLIQMFLVRRLFLVALLVTSAMTSLP